MAKIFRLGPYYRARGGIIRVCGKIFPTFLLACITVSFLGRVDSLLAQTTPPALPSLRAVDEAWKKEKKTGEEIWKASKELLRKGEWEKGQGELEKLYQWKLNQGIRNHFLYAAALVRESQKANQEGNPAAIPGLLNYAEKMAPDFAQITYARAHWLWSQNFPSFINISKAIWLWIQGFFLSLYNLEEALSQLANLMIWILSSFLITLVVFSFILLFKYHSFFSTT